MSAPQLPNVTYPQMRTNLQNVVNKLYTGEAKGLVTATGTADALILTYEPVVTEYASGASFNFIAADTNTNNVTVNINELGVKSILRDDGGQIPAGGIASGKIYNIIYDGTNFVLLINELDLSTLTTKTTLADDDKGVIEDSEALNVKKSFDFLSVWNYIKDLAFLGV